MTSPLSADEVLRLGELARKATPGPWAVCTEPLNDVWYKDVTIFRKEWGTRLADVSILESLYKENAAFIAAANPAAILSILSEMESLRAQVAVLVGELCDIAAFTSGYGDVAGIVCTKARKAIASVPESASTLLREVETLRAKAEHLASELTAAGICVDAALAEKGRMVKRAEAAEAQVETLRKTLASGYADVTVYHTKLQEMYALHNAALSRAEAAEARVTELEADVEHRRIEVEKRNSTIERLKARVTALEGQQPTGTITVCELCKSESLNADGKCPGVWHGPTQDHTNCPIKAARDGAKG